MTCKHLAPICRNGNCFTTHRVSIPSLRQLISMVPRPSMFSSIWPHLSSLCTLPIVQLLPIPSPLFFGLRLSSCFCLDIIQFDDTVFCLLPLCLPLLLLSLLSFLFLLRPFLVCFQFLFHACLPRVVLFLFPIVVFNCLMICFLGLFHLSLLRPFLSLLLFLVLTLFPLFFLMFLLLLLPSLLHLLGFLNILTFPLLIVFPHLVRFFCLFLLLLLLTPIFLLLLCFLRLFLPLFLVLLHFLLQLFLLLLLLFLLLPLRFLIRLLAILLVLILILILLRLLLRLHFCLRRLRLCHRQALS
mmetsp:Transcript_64452/g.114639  ORF Transcript_64452/g.114639 Transcript_64452/m.114639 type:complete len:299 (+) Transcript_64452:825-1721(+)